MTAAGDGLDPALLDMIYGGIRAPETWPDIVRAVGDRLDADMGLMLSPAFPNVLPVPLVAYGIDMSTIASIYPKYAGRAIFTQRALATGRAPGAFLLDELMPPEEQATSEFWREVVVPMRVSSGIFTMLRTPEDNQRSVILNLYRVGERPKFDGDDIKRIEPLIPHLRRALSVVLDAPPVARSTQEIKEVYDAIGAACFLLDFDGQVSLTNKAAEQLLSERDGIELRDGRLLLSDAPAQTELNGALNRTIGDGWSAKFRTGAELLARRPSGNAPLVLVVTPIGAENAIAAVATPTRCAVFVLEEKLRTHGLLERLQRLYGLTAAEAEICMAIASGGILAEIASSRGTTPATVRSQVKAALAKTGARRQADLAALVNRLRF